MSEKPTRKEAREIAREKAREMRLANQKKEKRKKLLIWGSTLGSLAIIGGLVALVIAASPKPVEQQIPTNILYGGFSLENPTKPILNTAGNASASRSEDKVYVDIYLDYLCPYCKIFEELQSQVLADVTTANDNMVVTYYPISFLGEYSLVASNAITCVAEYQPEDFWRANESIFTLQPEEGAGRALSGRQVKNLISELFSELNMNQEVASCVEDMRFQDYLVANTTSLANGPAPFTQNVQVSGTPFVLVNGEVLAQEYLLDQEAMFFYLDELSKDIKTIN